MKMNLFEQKQVVPDSLFHHITFLLAPAKKASKLHFPSSALPTHEGTTIFAV
jgi:hypothetical protein